MPDAGLDKALEQVQSTPASDELWNQLEELADSTQRPEEVAKAYREALAGGLGKEDAERVAQRAVNFYQAWFVDSPEMLPGLLSEIVERYSDIQWAFERLVVLHTSAGQWDQLLALYDRALSTTREEGKRGRLLDEAARLAKDFAGQPDRATDYMMQLLELDPTNDKLVVSLERLLERAERWEQLLALWRRRIPVLPTADARATRLKLAACCLDQLAQPQESLDELRAVVEDSPGNADACNYLERILDSEETPLEARSEALNLLRKSYTIVERREDVIRVLQRAMSFVQGEERPSLHRECGNALAIAGRDADAMAQFAALLLEHPSDTDARRQVRALARRSGLHELHASALTSAAERCEDSAIQVSLWLEAAKILCDALEDSDGAIVLYGRVLDSDNPDPNAALSAAHQLTELLGRSDRHAEALSAMERTAALEPSRPIRRHVLLQAANLAERLGEVDHALDSYNRVLTDDPTDLEALTAMIDLHERNEHWAQLVEALSRRSGAGVSPEQNRADRIRIAEVQADKLEQPGAAIDSWLQVREQFGDDARVLAALDRLMAGEERFNELSEVLDGALGSERATLCGHINRLADLYRGQLQLPERALPLYLQTVELDPNDGAGRAGLVGLLEQPTCAAGAAEALSRAYERTGEWQRSVELVEPRLGFTEAADERAELLLKTSRLYEHQGNDKAAAMYTVAHAVRMDPTRLEARNELLRLAQETNNWEDAATALREAAELLQDRPDTSGELRRIEAEIHEQHLDDWASAFAAYRSAHELISSDLRVTRALSNAAARAGSWPEATNAAIEAMLTVGQVDVALMTALEQAAEPLSAFSELAEALRLAVVAHGEQLPAHIAQRLEGLISDWYRHRCDDHEAATAAARRAASLAPDDPATLQRLAELLQGGSGPELIPTLLRLDAAKESSLDALMRAASIALEASDDPGLVRNVLEKLLNKATSLWTRGQDYEGECSPEQAARWSVDQLVPALLEAGEADSAIRILLQGAQLPLGAADSAAMCRRAAELLIERREPLRAVDAYRSALASAPEDLATIVRLAELCEREENRSGAVALRLRELELCTDAEERLALRLAMARRAAAAEGQAGCVDALLRNLEEEPGHEASIDALYGILSERGRHAQLAEVLEQQAALLHKYAPEAATVLWGKAAGLAQTVLDDTARAIAAHEKVVELSETRESLDALAALHLERDEPAAASRWLERRLASAGPKERVSVLLKLARTQLRAEQTDDAIATLGSAFEAAPHNAEVRKLLIQLLRGRKSWAQLAATLSMAVEHATDKTTILAYAREAAELFDERLDTPDAAVPVLQKAVELAPEDRKLRAMLGEGLREAGRLEEAHEVLTALIEAFGRRGSPERAATHLQLAKVLYKQEQTDEALEQLEMASKMDTENVTILRSLAEMAQQAGQLERAERAFHTLLLTVRGSQDASQDSVGRSEVLLELSRIASARGQQDKADELAESALEALGESDTEALRLQKKLSELGEHELLLRLVDSRLSYIRSPHRRAEMLAQKAATLAGPLERKEDALEARLQAIDIDPSSPEWHAGTLELAGELGQTDRYLSTLETLLVRSRRGPDAIVRCELLLRLGEIHVGNGDFEGAKALFAQAEETGVRSVDVVRAQARAAGASGDQDEQMRLLEQLASAGSGETETRADAYYRMAEVQMASEERLASGLESLRKAMAEDQKVARACEILRRANERYEHHEELLEVYEEAARKCDDGRVLLHYLERRVAHPDATPGQALEAVNKAVELEESARAETLMVRAVEIGRQSADGLYAVDWALLGLAARRHAAGDLAGAVQWLEEAGAVADPEKVFALSKQVAEAAVAGGGDELKLAIQLYERLLEQDATARDAWQPLVDIYQQLGDIDALERVVRETLDGLQEPEDRNALRVQLARALLGNEERASEATGVLRDALLDDPSHLEAQQLLAEQLERAGDREGLIVFLRDRAKEALGRGDDPGLTAISLRLGKLLEDEDPAAACEVYWQALARVGDVVELLEALEGCLGPEHDPTERAQLGERLLALQQGEVAASRARALAELYTELGDAAAALRVLEAGYLRAPSDEVIREKLTLHYRENDDFDSLIGVLMAAIDGCEEPDRKRMLLCEAAAVQREQLRNPRGAIPLLEQARELDPSDTLVARGLASSLMAAGDQDAALGVLAEALEGTEEESERLSLLLTRASMNSEANDLEGALADLEAAFAIEPGAAAQELDAALAQRSSMAASSGDHEAERKATLRRVEVLLSLENQAAAIQLLTGWLQRAPQDVEALRQLCKLNAEAAQWNLVVVSASQLADLETGDEQVEAAALFARAWTELGAPENAREVLEQVWRQQPENPDIRGEARKLYQQIGAQRELAEVYLMDAYATEDTEEKVQYLSWGAQTLLGLGYVDRALPALEQLLVLKPDDINASCLLSDAHAAAGRLDEADQLLDDAIKAARRAAPSRALLLQRKARLAAARGDAASQLDCLKQAHSADRKNAAIAIELADLAEVSEQWDLASKVLRAISLLEDEPLMSPAQALVRQGHIALRQGDQKKALYCAKRALKADAELPEAQALMQQLES